MTQTPNTDRALAADPTVARVDPGAVDRVLASLNVIAPAEFLDFYRKYKGPFAAVASGYELLDLEADDENIVSSTTICRSEFGFPDRYLVISGYLANAVLVYDTETGAVFDVDFEGSDLELIEGRLAPEWSSFNEFLEEYFSKGSR